MFFKLQKLFDLFWIQITSPKYSANTKRPAIPADKSKFYESNM